MRNLYSQKSNRLFGTKRFDLTQQIKLIHSWLVINCLYRILEVSLMCIALSVLPFNSYSQIVCSGCGTISGLPTSEVCYHGLIYDVTPLWTGDYTIQQYTWSPSVGVTDSIGTTFSTTSFLMPATCTTYTLSVNALSNHNEIGNGNINDSTLPIGFNTDYDTGSIYVAGNYHITTTTTIHTYACPFTDHTGGGYMLMYNGATDSTKRVLYGGVNLCCGVPYHFSIYGANWGGDSSSYAKVKITINGISHLFDLSSIACGVWTKYEFDFTPDCTGDTGITNSTIIDIRTVNVGNDFSLDDISIQRKCTTIDSFRLCPFYPIIGPTSVCAGDTIALIDSAIGGFWSSSDSTIASVDSVSGIVITHVSSGTVTITYTQPSTGCIATKVIIVNQNPFPITGSTTLCVGDTSILSDILGSGTWGSSNTSVATITSSGSSSGTITAISSGTTIITYTLSATGCFITMPFTVWLPLVTGDTLVCLGATTTLSSTPSGGTWSSGTTTVATTSGSTVTGIDTGTAIISYGFGGGCYTTTNITVLPLPNIVVTATPPYYCIGGSSLLSATGGTSYSWSPPTSLSAVIGTPVIANPLTSTTYVVTGLGANGCSDTASVTVTVNSLPVISVGNICIGDTSYMGTGTSGTWVIGGTGSIDTFSIFSGYLGVVGTGAGTVTVTFTDGTTGCSSSISFIVNPSPPAITGPTAVCVGDVITLIDTSTDCGWYDQSGFVSIDPFTGIVTGLSGYNVDLIYYQDTITGCYAQYYVTVNSLPVVSCPNILICCSRGGSGTFSTTVDGISDSATLVANYTFSWSPSTFLSDSTIPDPTVTIDCEIDSNTVYTLTVTNISTGCQTTITTTAIKIPSGVVCSPCNLPAPGCGSPYQPLGVSGAINTNVPTGNYYISNDVTIFGNITFDDAVIQMGSGVHIYVEPKSSLTLNSCHLFSCDSMWGGMVLVSDGTNTGTLVLKADSAGVSNLIEDAIIGVDIDSPSSPNMYQPYFLASYNAIFNRNFIGIQINNYNVDSSTIVTTPNTYPFLIENTVFTSRDFSAYNSGGCAFPFRWPNTFGTYGLKTNYSTPNNYVAPYNISNPIAGPGGVAYPGSPCHAYTPVTIGIKLNNVGYYGGISNPYISIQIGTPDNHNPCIPFSSNEKLNLFDTLNFGIYAIDADVTALNNSFTHMVHNFFKNYPQVSGDGIFAQKIYAKKCQLSVIPGITGPFCFTVPVVFSPNNFYNCPFGVYALNYDSIAGNRSFMVTTQTNDTNTNSGFYGYDIQTNAWNNYNITQNRIYNIANGIVLKMASGVSLPTVGTAGIGQATINNNKIKATFSSTISSTDNHYVDKAIWVENTISYVLASGAPPVTNHINTDDNILSNVYNGIYINNIGVETATSNADTILLRKYPAYMGAKPPQYGIWHLNCTSDQIRLNMIYGTPSIALYTDDSLRGVKVSSSSRHIATCNYIYNVGIGFEFETTHSSSVWQHNTMTNNGKGFVLNGAQIWTQGTHLNPCDNRWLTSGGFTWSLAHLQTATEHGAVPTNSTLWVYSGTACTPFFNAGFSGSLPYSIGGGLDTTVVSSSFSCSGSPIVIGNPTPLMKMTQKLDTFSLFQNQHHWMSQYCVWDAINKNDTLTDSSDVLATFKSFAQNSRFKLLTSIDNKLATGSLDSAQSLLNSGLDTLVNTQTDSITGVKMADDITANGVVGSYKQYYQLYLNFLNNNLSGDDSLNIEILAGACPFTSGPVVYNARALYNILNGTQRVFSYTCDTTSIDTSSTGARKSKIASGSVVSDNSGQSYILLPNPNDGNFILHQVTADNQPVKIEVLNTIGQCVSKQEITFNTQDNGVNLGSIQKGLYVLKLVDSNGRKFIFKFVVQ